MGDGRRRRRAEDTEPEVSREGPPPDEDAAEPVDPEGDEDGRRPRRVEVSARDRRRRRRRAAKAARRGRRTARRKETAAGPVTDDAGPGTPASSSETERFTEEAAPRRRSRRERRGQDSRADVEPLLEAPGLSPRDRSTSEELFAGQTSDQPQPDDEEPADHGEEPPRDDEDLDDEPDEEDPSRPDVVLTPTMGRDGRRPSHRWLVVGILGVVVLAVLGVVGAQLGWFDLARDMVGSPDELEEPREPPEDGWQPAFLLASYDSTTGPGELHSLAVLATDRREEQATVLLIPTSTITDVPGFGSFTLREAWELGGASLVAVTVDNLLGLRIDGVLGVDADGWASWFEQPEGAIIEVPRRIQPAQGSGRVGFDPGQQQLGPTDLSRYALIRGQGESELDVLPRTRQLVNALLDAIAQDPAALEAAVDAARTFPGTATPERIRTVLGELAEARQRDDLTTITMPVIPLGSGEDDLYRSDDERLADVMDDRFAASRADQVGVERLAVQILNGNGRPGVGQEVAEQLADGRYRIVLTGNADRFTYRETRIVVYSEERDILLAAQDVQERLGGIGTIERSGTPQSVVDLTIVVGADFPPS